MGRKLVPLSFLELGFGCVHDAMILKPYSVL